MNDIDRAGKLFGTVVRFLDHKDYMLPAIKELPNHAPGLLPPRRSRLRRRLGRG